MERKVSNRISRAVQATVAGALALAAFVLTSGPAMARAARASASTASATPVHGGNLIFARSADILSLDPTQMTDNESIWTAETMYETLYVATPNGKQLKPWLATGYSLSSNHLVWTFHLRHGVLFQNGKPMTSADVKFSIARVSAKASNPFAFIDAAIKSISTPNKYTVVIKTKYPWAPLLADVALFANSVIPNNYGGESETDFFKHPIGTGPFEFQSWSKGNRLVLTRNTHYWQSGKPYLNSVTFTNVTNNNTRDLQLQGGQAQVDEFPPASSFAQLKNGSGTTATNFPSSWTEYLEFNEKDSPFSNAWVRRAIATAINRSQIVKTVLFGYGQVANSFLSPALWAWDSKISYPKTNLAQAKKDLARSNVPHGFSTTLLVGAGVTSENSMGALIQADLAPLGIKVTLKSVDPDNEYTDIQNGQYQMGFNYDTTDIIDPDELVSFSAMGGKTGQQTRALFSNYNSPAVDKWAQQSERTFNQSKRVQLYDKVQEQMESDVPLLPLYYQPFAYAYSTKVHGLQIYPTGNYHLENVWLSK